MIILLRVFAKTGGFFLFEIKNVSYKDILFIDSLKIEEGEITCILGKSGGGKTTLLKLLNHLYSYDTGSITFKGDELKEIDPIDLRRKVVMLGQNPAVFPGTVRDNLILGLRFHGIEYNDEQLLEILKKVYLDIDLDADASNLSGGEKQRLALGAVLLLNPKIMLLDEPSSALDEDTEEFIIDMVVNYIKKKNGTLIMVTHSGGIAREYADRIIRVDKGRIIEKNVQGVGK